MKSTPSWKEQKEKRMKNMRAKLKKKRIMFLLLGLALILGILAYQYKDQIPLFQKKPTSLGWLHTEGRWIKDEGGRTVILRGAVWINTCYQRAHWIRHDITVADIDLYKSCGANVLFVCLNKKAWETEPIYIAEIDNIVNLCEQRDIYVILQLHVNHLIGVGPGWGVEEKWAMLTNPAAVDDIINWEKTVATRYVNRRHVVGFGDINEPIVDPSDPVYSGYTRDQVLQTLRNFHIQAILGLQSVNPNLLIFVEGQAWSTDLRDYIATPLPEPNVVYTFHLYYHHFKDSTAWGTAYRDGNLAEAKAMYEDFLKTRALNIMLVQNRPFFFAEFATWGPPDPDPNQEQWLLDHYGIMRKYGCSWTYFGFHAKLSTETGSWWLLIPDWSTLSVSGELWRNELRGK